MQNFAGRWRKYINFACPLSKIMCNVNDKKNQGYFLRRKNLHILLYLSVPIAFSIQQIEIIQYNMRYVCVQYTVLCRYVGLQ